MAKYSRYSKKTSGIAGAITGGVIVALLGVLAWTNWGTVWNAMGHVDHWSANTFGTPVHHQYVEDVREDATCEGDGFVINRCGVCGDEHMEVLEATGHTPDEETVVIVPSTDTEAGTKSYICLDCGETIVEELHMHTPEVLPDGIEPTCTTDGMMASVVCADCGEVLEGQEEIPALGHNFVDGACDRCAYQDLSVVFPDGFNLVKVTSQDNMVGRIVQVGKVGEEYTCKYTISSGGVLLPGYVTNGVCYGMPLGDIFVYDGYYYVQIKGVLMAVLQEGEAYFVEAVAPFDYSTSWSIPESDHINVNKGDITFSGTGEVSMVTLDQYKDFQVTFTVNEVSDVRGAFQLGFGAATPDADINTLPFVQFNYDRPVVVDADGNILNNYWINGSSWTLTVKDGALTLSCENGVVCENLAVGADLGYIVLRAENSCALTIHNLVVVDQTSLA